MVLYVILKILDLYTGFYISYIFLYPEFYNDYLWVLSSLQQFYKKRNIPNSIFIDNDYEKALISTIQNIIFFNKNTLYLWHIDKNVYINCKLLFNIKKS